MKPHILLFSVFLVSAPLLPVAAWSELPPVYCTQWGAHGAGQGQLDDPAGVAVDAGGNVYVTDTYNYRIQVFCPVPTAVQNTTWGGVKSTFR